MAKDSPYFKFYVSEYPGEWFTANRFCADYKNPPRTPGVYAIVSYNIIDGEITDYVVLYIGSSSNLLARFSNHPLTRTLNKIYGHTRFIFMETTDYLKVEVSLIKSVKPLLNIQHNG